MASQDAEAEDAAAQRNQKLQELLAACALHDRQAFHQLYEMTSAKLYGVILRILVQGEWAEDCLQEAYVKVWNRAESYRPHLASPMTWMATIARNQALDLLRRRHREVRITAADNLPEEVDRHLLPQDKLQQTDEGRRLNRCLEQLQSAQRQIIALAYFKGLTHEELAARTATPLGTVKTWIRRGLKQLRRCLEA
ncbi:MAG: sigma-70 family RNA polymerase sigma factor [Gammaproteobacteria bacterium]|nr:sigma-70 family RNA polymerase sigma factor [Gammaproteobacteria bacterium]